MSIQLLNEDFFVERIDSFIKESYYVRRRKITREEFYSVAPPSFADDELERLVDDLLKRQDSFWLQQQEKLKEIEKFF